MSFRTSTTLPDQPAPESVAPHTALPQSGAPSHGFPRNRRVTRGPEIEQVRQKGKRVRTTSMDVRAIASLGVSTNASHGSSAAADSAGGTGRPAVPGRVGIIVPKYGHSSVERNKVKRRLRELVRIEVLPVLPAVDAVVRVFPNAYARTFDQLREEVRKWSQQLVTGRGAR